MHSKRQLIWIGPIFNHSGYAEELRSFVLELSSLFLIKLISASHVDPEYMKSMSNNDKTQLIRLLSTPIEKVQEKIVIFHVPAHAFFTFSDVNYHIGRTMFETNSLPKTWANKCNLMNEIWVPSKFNAKVFQSSGVDKPIFIIPPAIDTDYFHPEKTKPLLIETDRKFRFLSVFQWIYRKGWDILLNAWIEAFSSKDDVCLLLRAYPYGIYDNDKGQQWIQQAINNFLSQKNVNPSDIAPIIILKHISDDQMPALYKSANAFVLPSRGEAYGRSYLEAMSMALPTIGPRWGGNLDFMNDKNSYLIKIEDIETINNIEPSFKFYIGCQWAKPSWKHLAELMLSIYKNEEEATKKGMLARDTIVNNYAIHKVCYEIADRINNLKLPRKKTTLKISQKNNLHIFWEGPIQNHTSFALVNKEIYAHLIQRGYKVKICDSDPQASNNTNKSFNNKNHLVHISHQWPPSFNPIDNAHFVLMQPWEYGFLPQDWIEPIQTLVDEIWVYSKFVWKVYVRSGISPSQLVIIPLGVNDKIFNPKAKPYVLPTNRKFRFLFVGGTIWRKGIDLLLQAYIEEFSKNDDVTLIIKDVGIESFYQGKVSSKKILQLQEDSKNPEIIYITNTLTQTEIAGLYTACHCLVHPYRGEGFCLPALEAMACNLPVIVTMGGATDDFCKEEWAYLIPAKSISFTPPPSLRLVGDKGLVLEPDKDSLKKLMRYVYENYEEAQYKAQLGCEYVLSQYTWDKVVNKIIERLVELKNKPIRRFQMQKIQMEILKLCKHGEELFRKGKRDEASKIFKAILQINPLHTQALNNLAVIHWQKGDLKKSIYYLQKAMAVNPNDKDVIWNYGQIMMQLGQLNDVYKICKQFLQKHPEEKIFEKAIKHIEDLEKHKT